MLKKIADFFREQTANNDDEPDEKKALETGRIRLLVTGAVFSVIFLGISYRLFDVTLINKQGQEVKVVSSGRSLALKMDRADIVDRNGVLLASSLPTASLFANPRDILDSEEAASKLTRILPELNREDLVNKFNADKGFIYLKRNLTPKQQFEINRLGIPGLDFRPGEKRVYPQGHLVAHVMGLTDVDNNGIAGVEKTFDSHLKGGKEPLKLSLDIRVQYILYQEMQEAIRQFKALGGAGMVMDVHTGEVVGMVSLPDFDPNIPSTATDVARFNRTTLGVYEMGSVFKLFTAAAAMDAGNANLNTQYDAREPIQISRFTISDYHSMHRFMSVQEIIVHSSNVGMAKMAQELGVERQRDYMGRFGFLNAPKFELPEVGGPLIPSPWREINAMTISYGHGLSVSPLQLVTGLSALVNGGLYRNPTLIKQGDDGPIPAKRNLSDKSSEQIRRAMRMVVEGGTGTKAESIGYYFGGKTGTAEKYRGGGYAEKALLSSFVGAFPIDNPRYAILIMIDEPQGTKESFGYATGGWVSAPIISKVVSRIGPMLGVLPKRQGKEKIWEAALSKGDKIGATR